MIVARVVLGIAVLLAAAGPSAGESLRDQLGNASETVGLQGGGAFDALADVIADTAARSLPVPSASAGFTYRFNPELEIFERTSETLGPIFLERPDTLGRSRFNVNVSFQYVQFDSFDGDDLTDLQAADPVITQVVDGAGNLLGFTANDLRYRIGIQNYITALSFTYGILDNLDANIFLPLIQTTQKVGVRSQQVAIAGTDGAFAPVSPLPPAENGQTTGGHFGVGDILLRFKYQLPRQEWLRWAAGLQFRLPSGNEDDYQGTGDFEITPALYMSTVLWNRVTPYLNGAIDIDTQGVSGSQARYGIGADVDITRRVGLALAFLGRSEFADSASAADTSFLHLVNGVPELKPLLGVNFDRNNFLDFSFGTRVVVWRDIMLFVNGIYAVNDAGLRNDTIIPSVGVEGTF
jgi:hypothetical protein